MATTQNGEENAHSLNIEDNECTLQGWTKAEKFALLQCLKTMGSYDITLIQTQISTKNLHEIQSAIKYYKTKAKSLKKNCIPPKKTGRPRTIINTKPNLPLSNWAKFLTDSISYEDLQTEIATALRLIAEFETIPQTVCTEYIDFRKAYNLLANAVEGKALEDDKLITALINKCILETALSSKMFLRTGTLRQIVDKINISSDKDVKSLLKPVTSKEFALLQHLSDQRNYNPLDIKEEYLRPETK